jgi:hypothetical protein
VSAIKIDVTSDDIAKGEREQPCRCPIALALTRAHPGQWVLGEHTADFYFDDADGTISLPNEARDFIKRFDNGDPVEPFSFELELDEP